MLLKMSRYRNVMITFFKEPAYLIEDIEYLVYQKEKCPTTKKIHWQGYAEWNEKKSFKQIKKIFNDQTIHIEPRYGNQAQAIIYCTKLESRVEQPIIFGSKKQQGHRSDLDSIVDSMESGHTRLEILRTYKGNALRHMQMIREGLVCIHGEDLLDQLILTRRKEDHHNPLHEYDEDCFLCRATNKCPEVEGNTDLPLLDIETYESLEDEYSKITRDTPE